MQNDRLQDEDYSRLQEMPDGELSEAELREKYLQGFGVRLKTLYEDQQKQRVEIEKRWISDLKQYNGFHPDEEPSYDSTETNKRMFVNVTRPRTNAAIAQLGDMLLPNDDRNWGIEPTPVPEMSKVMESDMADQPAVTRQGSQIINQKTGQPITWKEAASAEMQRARDACEGMEAVINDQLTECDYNAEIRDVLFQAGVYGTGVIKAPFVTTKLDKRWSVQLLEDGTRASVLEMQESTVPAAKAVSVWDFFPDMSARSIDEADFTFERIRMLPKDLRALAANPNFDEDQIRKALIAGAKKSQTVMSQELRNMRRLTGIIEDADDKTFEVVMYRGSVEPEEVMAAGIEIDEEELDELTGFDAEVWFVGDIVIRAILIPEFMTESIYSTFSWECDDNSIFGYGVPYVMRNQQRSINSTWQMMQDNAAIGVGSQIIINKRIINPADGTYNIYANKVWEMTDPQADVRQAFNQFSVNMHLPELKDLYDMAMHLVDEETGIHALQQGAQGTASHTLGGMSILQNNATIVRRRQVREFDDGITTPVIRRFYDWNMEYSDREEIKGDFSVKARGSSVLMVRELQSQNLTQLASQFASHPVFSQMTDFENLYRKVLESYQISADEVMKSKDEIKAMQEAQAQSQQNDPQIALAQAKIQLAQRQLELKAQESQANTQIKAGELQLKAKDMQLGYQVDMYKMKADEARKAAESSLTNDIKQAEIRTKRDTVALQERNKMNELNYKRETGNSGI